LLRRNNDFSGKINKIIEFYRQIPYALPV